jgi:hypothetical protein
MGTRLRFVFPTALLAVGLLAMTGLSGVQQPTLGLKIEDVMTAQELKNTGVAGLSPSQRTALNAWLNRYTENVFKIVAGQDTKKPVPDSGIGRSDCVPAIESTLAGDFNGWEGETIFKLDNGQIWEQAEYNYTYSYSYRPEVTIYQTSGGCRMKVEDEEETILVRRIR